MAKNEALEPGQAIAEARIVEARKSRNHLLDLLGLGLKTLPRSIVDIKDLRILQLSYNQLTELPKFIGDLTEIQELDLSCNSLTSLPLCIGELPKLVTLDVSGNQLSQIPETLSNARVIQRLDLSDNRLPVLPAWLRRFGALQFLDVSGNRLSQLPSWIDSFIYLRVLDISDNEIYWLPPELGGLGELEHLNAARIRLAHIPSSFFHLKKLTTLDLSSNSLQELPESLLELTELRSLLLHENPKLRLPRQILGPPPGGNFFADRTVGARQILEYYFEARRDSKVLNEARLIVIGRGYSGKTSIINRVVSDTFDRQQARTDGITIQPWHLRGSQGEPYLSIWDFGGQEMMHATHQFFLSENSLYLLVINGREGHEDYDAYYWLQLVNSLAGDSPVIVVQNKILEQNFDLNYSGLTGQYPQIVGFCKTDCANGVGIVELRKLIRKAIQERMHFMRDLFPASWFRIKMDLAEIGEDYLSYQRFRELCANHNLIDPEQQDSLARYLHCLGVALNYKEDPRLRETSVLKPSWVTEGIYRILTHPQLAARYGEMFVGDLASWLNQDRYPSEKHAFLLELMRKFRLCFSFPDDPNHYLVPELLNKEYPPAADDFFPDRCLNFEYHYPVLPEGLLPQFIVRTQTLSQGPGSYRWRSGAVLVWDNTKALIMTMPTDRRVVVRVSGSSPDDRGRLLAVVRADFDRIHRQIPSLRVEEKVPLPGYPDDAINYKELVVLERNGETEYTKVVTQNGREIVAKFKVASLLNGVDVGGVRSRIRSADGGPAGLRLFISYSHEDEALKRELELHLKLLERQALLSTWSDRCLVPGSEWDKEIDRNIDSADIILLLVSVAFVNSHYCYDKEMTRALERHASGEAVVIPVILRPLNWTKAPFAKLTALPRDGIPVTVWKTRDEAWEDVARGIERTLLSMSAV
jgi:internalin A